MHDRRTGLRATGASDRTASQGFCGGRRADLGDSRVGAHPARPGAPQRSFERGRRVARDAERLGQDVAARVLAPAEALPDLAAVRPNEAGLRRVLHGNPLGPEHLEGRWVPPATSPLPVRIVAADGRLIALARSRGGALHPVVVLG